MTALPLNDIIVGDRDREDFGDVEALAKSIAEVGLLHPVVVTETHQLVAGDRRLAAVKSLGWQEVPVTVVNLATAGEVLKAEADENTCRKPLTPYEASRARQRRVEVLAPIAEARKKAGRPSSKLDEGPATSRASRKVASLGTGYSGSTLDKVDNIRSIAERGVVKQGRAEVAAPAPVVDIAKRALDDVKKTGAAVAKSDKDVRAALAAYMETDPSVQRAAVMKSFAAKQSHMSEITQCDVDEIADAMTQDDYEIFQTLKAGVDHWANRLDAARTKPLRAINGGK